MGNRMAIVVAVVAVLLFVGTYDDALAAFQNGDFVSYQQFSWGDETLTFPGATTLVSHYDTVYASTLGELEVGIPGSSGHSIIFTGQIALLDYLAALGFPGQLLADLVDPLSSASGVFGGEVTALHLNIDFSDAGHTLGALGIPFGDLVIHSYAAIPQVNGLMLRQLLGQVDTLLGGGTVGYGVLEANALLNLVNFAFENGQVSQFAQDHLRLSSQVPEPGTLVLMGVGVAGLAARHFTRRRRIRGRP